MTPRMRAARDGELDELLAIDDAATALFTDVGLALDLAHDHPFVVAELGRWSRAIAEGTAWVATNARDAPIGFAVAARVDGVPYLDQLAVHPGHMRRGIGRHLVERVAAWAVAHGSELRLTTYAHVSFNRPYYERLGFSLRDESCAGPELEELLREQRRYLADPEQRVVMSLRLSRGRRSRPTPRR